MGRPKTQFTCTVPDCADPAKTHQKCPRHYNAWYRRKGRYLPTRLVGSHGHAKNRQVSAEWKVWQHMKNRCRNPNAPDFNRYGGRGIKVCERWSGPRGFENFLADMGERPLRTSLDRIDNEGDYSPDNCRWATILEQANNKRNNAHLTVDGITLTIPEWSRRTGINHNTIRTRLAHGWSAEKIMSTPVGRSWKQKAYPREVQA